MASGFNDTSTGKITFAEMMKEYKIPASKNDVDEVKHFQPDRALKPTKSRQFYSKQDLPQSLICEQIQRMCVISVEQTPVQSSENPVDQLPDLIIDGDRVILLSDKYFKYTEEAVKDTSNFLNSLNWNLR